MPSTEPQAKESETTTTASPQPAAPSVAEVIAQLVASVEAANKASAPTIWDGVKRLVGSSKAIVVMAGIAASVVLAYYHLVTGAEAMEFSKWLILAFIGAVAVEDGALKLRTNGGSSGTAKVASAILSALTPTLPAIMAALTPRAAADQATPPPDPLDFTGSGPDTGN